MPAIADGLDLLRREHREIERLLEACLRSTAEPRRLYAGARALCCRLATHSVLEMQLLLPPLREAGIDPDYIDEAIIEQVLLEDLVAGVIHGGPGDPLLGARLMKLGDLLCDHVRVQERELFALARVARVDTRSIGDNLVQMREHARVHVLRHLATLRAREEQVARERGEFPAPVDRMPPYPYR